MTKLLAFIRLRRLAIIIWVFSRFRLDELANASELPFFVRLIILLGPWKLLPKGSESRAVRLRLALERLGPIFIKFGQVLSTRRDLLPDDLADELQKLQDRVPPFAGDQAEAIIEQSLGAKTGKLFSEFEREPLASASVAQVHAAKLRNGRDVVVKVIRPNILPTIKQDIHVLMFFAMILERFWSEGKRLHPVEVVVDYERTIHDELDLQREAANCSQLRRNFLNSELIYIPEVYWDYCHKNVMVMERISGIPVADIQSLKDHQINLKLLAERGVEIFFTQVFRDSFFHADMHPGNIFVAAEKLVSPQYIAVDFGIVGTLSPDDQNYLARNLLAFFKRDYRLVAQLHIDSGWVPEGTRVDEFEAAIRTVCEPIFEKPLKDISFAQFLLRLFQTAQRFNMEVQPQLVLLQKTLLNIEGLGRQLYPDLDLWNTAKPYLEGWMRNRIAPPGVLNAFKQQFPEWVEHSPEIPQLVFDALTKIKHLEQDKTPPSAQISTESSESPKTKRKLVIGALAVAAGIAYAHPETANYLVDVPWQTMALVAFGLSVWIF